MAQVAVERTRRQEDRSAIGSFPPPSPPFLYLMAGPRTLRRESHAGPCQETKTQKGRSTREGSALCQTRTTPKAMAKRHLQDII